MAKSTAAYIDGYNLYYGRIRGTAFKWLDVVRLVESLLRSQDPTASLKRLRYFSSHALARFATNGEDAVLAQQTYLRALSHLYPDRFSSTLGKHSYDRNGTLLPEFIEGEPYDRNRRVRVWKLEEKQTDVNLALSMYRDAASGHYRQLVVCSNDSDVEPVLRAIREDFPDITLGVITPRCPPDADSRSSRSVSAVLAAQADWTRRYLLDDELAAAQLPDRIARQSKPILRPRHW